MAAYLYRANILNVIDDNYEKYFPINRTAADSMQSADSMGKMLSEVNCWVLHAHPRES